MKKIISSLTLICCVLNSFSALHQFVLKGKTEGFMPGNVVLSYQTVSNNKREQIKFSTVIKNNSFLITGNIEEPVVANLEIGTSSLTLYIEPNEMELYISKDYPEEFKLKGSKTQDEAVDLSEKTRELDKYGVSLLKKNRKIYHLLDSLPKNHPQYSQLLEESKAISSKRDSVNELIAKIKIDYLRKNPNSYFPLLSNSIIVLISQEHLSIDSARIIFDRLSENIKSCSMGIETNKYIKMKENIVIGKFAPDFNTPDVKGQMIKLSSYKGKRYVMLDFWASWCSPCIEGLSHLKEINTKYHDKGLQVIGISSDRKKREWIDAIEKHQISIWPEVSIVQDIEKASQGYFFDEDIQSKYPIDGIPKYILIDKIGKIIGKWDGYSEENEKEQDKLLKEIFGD
jgi:peroxiredoxin